MSGMNHVTLYSQGV